MTLKPIQHPTFEIEVPSTKVKLKFRPWLAKEDKILLMAASGENDLDLYEAAKQIVTNCCVDILPKNLASFDWEYIFIQLRANSVGESVVVFYESPESECPKCKEKRGFRINLREVKVVFDPKHTNKIQLDKDLWIVMKYPANDQLIIKDSSVDEMFVNMARSVEQIVQGELTITGVDLKEDEVVAFLESLNREQIEKIDYFFSTIPHLEHTVDLSCAACGRKGSDTIKGMSGFFV